MTSTHPKGYKAEPPPDRRLASLPSPRFWRAQTNRPVTSTPCSRSTRAEVGVLTSIKQQPNIDEVWLARVRDLDRHARTGPEGTRLVPQERIGA
jgi:hypothetical protein